MKLLWIITISTVVYFYRDIYLFKSVTTNKLLTELRQPCETLNKASSELYEVLTM